MTIKLGTSTGCAPKCSARDSGEIACLKVTQGKIMKDRACHKLIQIHDTPLQCQGCARIGRRCGRQYIDRPGGLLPGSPAFPPTPLIRLSRRRLRRPRAFRVRVPINSRCPAALAYACFVLGKLALSGSSTSSLATSVILRNSFRISAWCRSRCFTTCPLRSSEET